MQEIHATWLKEGENNKYFYRFIHARKAQNTICKIQDKQGVVHFCYKDITYYQVLIQETVREIMESISNIKKLIREEQNKALPHLIRGGGIERSIGIYMVLGKYLPLKFMGKDLPLLVEY